MDARQRVRRPAEVERAMPHAAPSLGVGASVVVLRPRRLRGTIGVVQRQLAAGWEVEIRTSAGTPMHLTLPAKALHPR